MSNRRNGSVSRAVEAASKNRLHMDRNPQHSRITDPSNPAGRRKEIDNVMKRARQASPGSWDRKLLEVEEKDPNRWRHTGYKQLYLDGSRSPSPKRSRSPMIGRRSRTPIHLGNRSRTPLAGRRSRSPMLRSRTPLHARRSRSPVMRRSRTPIRRKSRSRSIRRSPRRSPIRNVINRRSPLGPSPRRRSPRPRSPADRRPRPRPPRPLQRPPSPTEPRKSSPSGSSASSCSDESCSVCSAKNKKGPPPPPKPGKPPPKTASPARPKRPPPPPQSRAVQPTRELLKAREASKRTREEKVLEWQRSQLAVLPPPPGAPPVAPGATPATLPAAHIKREGERRRGVSPAAIQAALADPDSDSESDASSEPQPQRLTLSERFGRMAQWSADRSARLENMRITRREAQLHVRIEPDERAISPGGSAAAVAAADPYPGLDPAPVGSYPEELLAVAPGGLPSWDDVRVRYDYYKKRGYLRGLTLSDYVKWEEWWYKYQEWLKRERAYERWAEGEASTGRRERRRRGGRHRRS